MARPPAPEDIPAVLASEARFGLGFLRRHGLRLLLAFLGLLLPLWGFAAIAEDLHEQEAFFFDDPLLRLAHELAGAGLDRLFMLMSALGYQWGVIPADIALVLVLAWYRRAREGLFAGLALGGSALLNLGTKAAFARERPSLWESIAPESTYSFPSGHAMGSMTLLWVCLLLAWRTPWRVPVAVAAIAFVVLVGLSRIYLGVHYPSDILAGWLAASVWAVFCFLLVFRHDGHPWHASPSRSPR